MKTVMKKIILMVDDDPDDYSLIREAMEGAGLSADLRLVQDGVELMEYLFCRGKYKDNGKDSVPALILLDLNMPRKNGWDALTEIKADYDFCRIPVIIYTTSKDEEDIERSYMMGATSYIIKPSTFKSLVRFANALARYWTRIMENPQPSTIFKPIIQCTCGNEDIAFPIIN